MTDRIKGIVAYIEYLRKEYQLQISIHDLHKSFMYRAELFPYNVHGSGYCLYVKTHPCIWNRCILQQKKMEEKLKEGPFWGKCYLGVEEYVYPITFAGIIKGFICVSGYRSSDTDRKSIEEAESRMCHASEKYAISFTKLQEAYHLYLMPEKPNLHLLDTILAPLAAMLAVFSEENTPEQRNSEQEYIYAHILSYLHRHYAKQIHIEDICKLCHCSPAYLMRIFKKYTGVSIMTYLTQFRLEQSKDYLSNTDLSVTEIAYRCGFQDSNYFSMVFKKNVDQTPLEYRKRQRRG